MSVFFEQGETISISYYLCHYPEKKKPLIYLTKQFILWRQLTKRKFSLLFLVK